MISKTYTKFHLIILFNLQLCTIIRGSFNFEITQKVDGRNTKRVVPSLLELPSGANVTLVCKIVNLKCVGCTNAHVSWFKIHNNSIKSATVYTKYADLKLDGLSAQDEGHYACVSLQYSILKDVYVHILNDSREGRSKLIISPMLRLKRFKRDIGNATDLNYTYNNPDLADLQSVFENNRKMLDEYYKELENDLNSWDNYKLNNNYDLSFNIHQNNINESTSSPLKPIFLLIGVLLLIIFVSIIIRCYGANRDNSWNSTENQTNNRQLHTNNTRTRCGHSGCCRNHTINSLGACRFIGSTPTPLEETRLPTRLNVVRHVQNTGGDLPPNYTSTVNDNEVAPPSYEEAVANKRQCK